MNSRVLIIFSLVSGATLALAYRPIFNRLSLGLISPYPRADLTRRFVAATIDITLVAAALVSYQITHNLMYAIVGLTYIPARDAIRGRGIGKFICGLVVVNLQTGHQCGWRDTVSRNILFLIPGANIVAAFLEPSTAMREPQGLRLGDRFALTQVVEGFGAKDLVIEIWQWFLNIAEQFDQASNRPERAPVRIPR